MKIYNTRTKQLDKFQPLNAKKVNFFVCGPTVYDFAHLGHAKTYIQFDFIVKYLRSRGYDVFYLMNISDIDDKVIARAEQRNISWKELSEEHTQSFKEDMASLHNTAVDQYAVATDFIDAIIKQVKTLLDKGFAYKTTDGIYFEISKFSNYGKLSGRTELQEYDAVSRIDASPEKRGWNDFCLWKNYKEGEPFWETELGKGRPGWHIEDTAITETFFGPQYDVHGGGADLIFPHHEAEITQMESASGKSPLAKYWMHVGFLNVNSKKMGKSLGNFMTIRDILKLYDYRTLRYFFLSSHYRSKIDFTDEALDAAKGAVKRIEEFLFKADSQLKNAEEVKAVSTLKTGVTEVLDNDFNTSKALGKIFDFIRERNQSGIVGVATLDYFKELNELFGFMQIKQDMADTEIEELIKRRNNYRAKGEFAKSDAIRTKLDELGIQIYDSKDGTKWRKT